MMNMSEKMTSEESVKLKKQRRLVFILFFALTILFAGSAHAQYDIPDITPAADRCVVPNPDLAHSPSEACQMWNRKVYCSAGDGMYTINLLSGDDCTVTSGFKQNGTQHYYYFGDQYCIERGIGTPYHSKTCALRTDIAQPTPIPKLASAPGFQPLLEKSETQLEIERKAAENKIPPTKKAVPPKKDDAPPKQPPPDPVSGSPTILRGGKVVPFAPGFNIAPGDVVETGDGITAELISAGGAIYVRKGGTTVQFLGFRDNKVEPQSGPTLEDVKSELKSFAKNCSSSDYGACKDYTATVVMRGDVFFSEKMRDKFPDGALSAFNEKFPNGIVASVTAIIKHFGTEFGVSVAPDGATTVTTLEGSVLVMDIKSKQSILVGANQSITIPMSFKGLTEAELQQGLTNVDPGSIAKWWEKKTQEQIDEEFRYFMIGSLAILIVVIILILIFKKVKKNIKNRKNQKDKF